MTPSIHPAHCRCRRCMPQGPSQQRYAPTLAAAALALAVAACAVLAASAADRIHNALFTVENF